MKRTPLLMASLLTFFLTVLTPGPYCHGQTLKPKAHGPQYAIASRLPLSQSSNGVDGYLELRLDARLTQKLLVSLWESGNLNANVDPHLAVFKNEPPHNAVVQIVDESGKVLEVKKLERPL